MDKLFGVFCSFLLILTLLSTIGGGIRFRENFMEEVLDDMYEDISNVVPNVLKTIRARQATTMKLLADNVYEETPVASRVQVNSPSVASQVTGSASASRPTPSATASPTAAAARPVSVSQTIQGIQDGGLASTSARLETLVEGFQTGSYAKF